MKNSTNLKEQFLLDPSVTFLNFGSFGACPKPVFDDYQRWQRELEFEPVRFIAYNGVEYMKKSREALAGYINCNADDLVYTPNPTFAVNIIARNLDLRPGDEILSTDLEYGAMDRTWKYYCGKTGAKYVRQHIQFPIQSKEDFIEQFWKGYSDKTKVMFISHITSATALILPVKEICDEAKRRGLITIVDGAHVPGHIDLDILDLNPDFYTGACHKWMMTPKGSSFLYARRELQKNLDPLIISWGYEGIHPSDSQFLDYHQFNGTRDFSAYLSIPKSIEFMNENNWKDVASQCHQLVLANAEKFCDLTGTKPLSPVTSEFIGQMFSIPVRVKAPDKFQRDLFDRFRIEIPVTYRGEDTFVRYSINAYNSQEDLDKLYEALKELIPDYLS